MKKSHKIYAIVASFIAIFIVAITESIRGILVPTFKSDFNVGDFEIGLMVAGATLAYIIGSFIAGVLSKKMNQKQLVILGMIIAGGGFLFTSFVKTFSMLAAGYFILTIGIGLIVLGLNTIVPAIKVAFISVVINTLHFFYGVGATLVQRVSGYLIDAGVSWRHIFLVFAGLYVLGVVVYSFIELPKRQDVEKKKVHLDRSEYKLIAIFCVGLGFYVATEVQTLTWFLNYLKEHYHFTANDASKYVALFFGLLAVGRLTGGYILEKIGILKGIIIAISLAFVCYSIGLINEGTIVFVSISGLFCSIVYPTTMLFIQTVFEDHAMKVVAIVSMASSIINMVAGLSIGALNDTIGIRPSYFTIPMMLGLTLLSYLWIHLEVKKVDHKRAGGMA